MQLQLLLSSQTLCRCAKHCAILTLTATGSPDYLLYNASTHQTAIWYLNNNVHVGHASRPNCLWPAGAWQVWRILIATAIQITLLFNSNHASRR